MKPALLGSLTVNCKSAKLEKDADTFGKMDPFVRLTVGKVSKVTNVQEEGGVNPVWNQVLEFEINGEDEFVDIALLDSDGEKADSLGSGSLDFTALAKLPNKCEPLKVYLQQKGETVGTLELEVTFSPKKAKKLAITIEKADLKEDLDFWNKMDPFVIVTIGVTTKRTTIKEEVGKQPVWNEKLEFDVVLQNPKIEFTIRDDDGDLGAKFDQCGKAETTFNELIVGPPKKELQVLSKGADAGKLFISWEIKL